MSKDDYDHPQWGDLRKWWDWHIYRAINADGRYCVIKVAMPSSALEREPVRTQLHNIRHQLLKRADRLGLTGMQASVREGAVYVWDERKRPFRPPVPTGPEPLVGRPKLDNIID